MNVFELFAKLGLDTSEYDSGLEGSEKKASSFGAKIGHGLGAAAKIGGAAIATATTAVASGVVAMSKAAIDSYKDYEQLEGGIKTLFGETSDATALLMQNASNAYKTAGMNMNDYMETAIQSAAAMKESVGGDVYMAAKLTDVAITDMSDNVNKMGTSMEAVQNAYRGFSRGNFTMLDNLALGFSGSKEGMEKLLEKAKEFSGVEYDITKYADIVQAIHVVQEEMGIAGTTAAEASGTISGSFNQMKSAWDNLVNSLANPDADMDSAISALIDSVGSFADNLIPRISVAIDGVSKLFVKLVPKAIDALPGLLQDALPKLIDAVISILGALFNESILAEIQPFFEMIGDKAMDAITAILTEILPKAIDGISVFLPTLLKTALDLIKSLASFILKDGLPMLLDMLPGLLNIALDLIKELASFILTDGLPMLLEMLPKILETATILIETLVDFILTDGLPMLIEALPDIIFGIVDFILSASTEITEAVLGIIMAIMEMAPDIIIMLVSKLPEIITGIITAILKNAPKLSDAILQLTIMSLVVVPMIIIEILSRLPEIFTAIVNGFKENWPQMKQAGFDAFEQSLSGMFSSQIIQDLSNGIAKLIVGAVEKIKSFANDFKQAGQDVMNGLISGINDKIQSVMDTVTNIASTVSGAFKGALGIASPSKVFAEYGKFIDMGLANGVENNLGIVDRAMDSLYTNVKGSPTLAVAGGGGVPQQIVIPIYFGQDHFQTLVVDALNQANDQSGGR